MNRARRKASHQTVCSRFFQTKQVWVLGAGCALAFLSAAVNACFLIQLGTSVGHLTGDVSRVAVELISAQTGLHQSLANLVSATLGFLAGATSAGFFIHHPALEFSRPYGWAVAMIGVCLATSQLALASAPAAAIGLTAFGCGLQNALATTYKGTILRTTHVTGLLTDLGSNIGLQLRGGNVSSQRILVPLLLVLAFFAGAIAGSGLVLWGNRRPLLILAGLYLGGGLGWSLLKRWLLTQLKNRRCIRSSVAPSRRGRCA